MKIEIEIKSGAEALAVYEFLKHAPAENEPLVKAAITLRKTIEGAIEMSDEDITDPTHQLRTQFADRWKLVTHLAEGSNPAEVSDLIAARVAEHNAALAASSQTLFEKVQDIPDDLKVIAEAPLPWVAEAVGELAVDADRKVVRDMHEMFVSHGYKDLSAVAILENITSAKPLQEENNNVGNE